jgi:hypothetical protein
VWELVGRAEIGPRIAAGAGAIVGVLRSSAASNTTRPSPERWSTLEYGAHVRDVLLHVRDRFVIGAVEHEPEFKPLYRDERVALGLYARDDAATVSSELDAAAGLFVRTFAAFDEEQLARLCRYSYPTVSTRTLLWMGQQVVHEVEHHRGDVEENLRLLAG